MSKFENFRLPAQKVAQASVQAVSLIICPFYVIGWENFLGVDIYKEILKYKNPEIPYVQLYFKD